jgi:hypothetical protein
MRARADNRSAPTPLTCGGLCVQLKQTFVRTGGAGLVQAGCKGRVGLRYRVSIVSPQRERR